jgi:hypothetical protein
MLRSSSHVLFSLSVKYKRVRVFTSSFTKTTIKSLRMQLILFSLFTAASVLATPIEAVAEASVKEAFAGLDSLSQERDA